MNRAMMTFMRNFPGIVGVTLLQLPRRCPAGGAHPSASVTTLKVRVTHHNFKLYKLYSKCMHMLQMHAPDASSAAGLPYSSTCMMLYSYLLVQNDLQVAAGASSHCSYQYNCPQTAATKHWVLCLGCTHNRCQCCTKHTQVPLHKTARVEFIIRTPPRLPHIP
jgi:hypothetical protein